MPTTETNLSISAYSDLGAGPLMVQALGLCKIATASTLPDSTAPGIVLRKGEFLPIAATDHVFAMAIRNTTTIVAVEG